MSLARFRWRTPQCRAFTIVEAMLASVIVAFLVVAAMQAAGASGVAQALSNDRTIARFLADGLMAEILPLAYQDPGTAPQFGREAGELQDTRANYNDVDDYDDWSDSPPRDKAGNVLPGLATWKRSVDVDWVHPDDLSDTALAETHVKRIQVKIKHNNVIVATRVAIRTQAP